MSKRRPYCDTPVPIERSESEIYGLMDKYDVEGTVFVFPPHIQRRDGRRDQNLQSRGGSVSCEFQWPTFARWSRVKFDVEDWDQGDGQTAEQFRKDMRQEIRILGRTMYYLLKSTFEAIAAGALREDVALFAWTVLSDQTTIAERSEADLLQLLDSPAVLRIPAKAGPAGLGHDITRDDRRRR